MAGDAAALLKPLQFGVGVRGGCEAVVHATRATLMDTSLPPESRWCLLVDFENCFNQGDRERILEEVRNKFPQLSRWVECCYGTSSFFDFWDTVLLSAAWAPPLFSLLLQPVAERLQEVDGLELNVWYLDDGTLVGTREALQEAWDLIVREGVSRGLHLSRDKSLVFWAGGDVGEDPVGRGVLGVGEDEGGFKLLDAPVGSQDLRGGCSTRGWGP